MNCGPSVQSLRMRVEKAIWLDELLAESKINGNNCIRWTECAPALHSIKLRKWGNLRARRSRQKPMLTCLVIAICEASRVEQFRMSRHELTFQ